jgi:F0F1-type ATP synthase assembly protein I
MAFLNRDPNTSHWAKQVGLLSSIPFALFTGPALGYYLGTLLDRRWGSDPWGMGVGVAVGLAAGIHTSIQFIRQANRLEDRNRH